MHFGEALEALGDTPFIQLFATIPLHIPVAFSIFLINNPNFLTLGEAKEPSFFVTNAHRLQKFKQNEKPDTLYRYMAA